MVKICIVHYNTPNLTDALVRSIKRNTPDSYIYIFDNSDVNPWVKHYDNMTVFDNTKGQIINFEEWLTHYPKRDRGIGAAVNDFGSAKHCYSIEKCMDLIGDNFILLDSDVLIKRDISEICNDDYYAVADIERFGTRKRITPFICYINVIKCKENGIHFFDENRMLGFNITPQSRFYDTGGSFYDDVQNNMKRIDNNCYIEHYRAGSWLESARNKHHYKRIDPEVWLEENKHLWNYPRPDKVVYTCIIGGYDTLLEPRVVDPDVDYICFTDNTDIKSNVWEIRQIPYEVSDMNLSNVKKQRCIKINPHKYLSEYKMSLWVDGNIEILSSVSKLFNENIDKEKSVFIPQHPERNCIYAEGSAVIRLKKDTKENVNKQLNGYREEGFPSDYGLVQSNIIIRKHNDYECIKLMEKWWEELKNKSHRDQLSFNYAVWKLQTDIVSYLDKYIYKSEYFKLNPGHKKLPNRLNTATIIPNERTVLKEIKQNPLNDENRKVRIIVGRNGTTVINNQKPLSRTIRISHRNPLW